MCFVEKCIRNGNCARCVTQNTALLHSKSNLVDSDYSVVGGGLTNTASGSGYNVVGAGGACVHTTWFLGDLPRHVAQPQMLQTRNQYCIGFVNHYSRRIYQQGQKQLRCNWWRLPSQHERPIFSYHWFVLHQLTQDVRLVLVANSTPLLFHYQVAPKTRPLADTIRFRALMEKLRETLPLVSVF